MLRGKCRYRVSLFAQSFSTPQRAERVVRHEKEPPFRVFVLAFIQIYPVTWSHFGKTLRLANVAEAEAAFAVYDVPWYR